MKELWFEGMMFDFQEKMLEQNQLLLTLSLRAHPLSIIYGYLHNLSITEPESVSFFIISRNAPFETTKKL